MPDEQPPIRTDVHLGSPYVPGEWWTIARERFGERVDTRPSWAILAAVAAVIVGGFLAFHFVPVPHYHVAPKPIDTWQPPSWITQWFEPAVIALYGVLFLCRVIKMFREEWRRWRVKNR